MACTYRIVTCIKEIKITRLLKTKEGTRITLANRVLSDE